MNDIPPRRLLVPKERPTLGDEETPHEFEGGQIRKAREYNDTAHVFATLRAGQSAA